jgi:PAS domain S-box-containing protein
LLESQRRVLERIATGAPLEEVLHTLVTLIEEQAGDMRCGVLLADARQRRLRFAAAPSFPEDLKAGMEPFLVIAPGMASCGTAAYYKRPVYTRDTATDPLWERCREIALRNGVRASWSTPIVSDDNRVLGTFTMYYGEPRLPIDEHIQLIDMAVQMARVAIEASEDNELLRVTFDNATRAVVITDIDLTIVRANRAFAEQLGYAPADLRGKPISDITEGHDNGALLKELLTSEKEVSSDRRYRTRRGAILWARERSSVRCDASGKPCYVVTHVDKLSDAGHDPLGRLSRRERQVLELVVAGRKSKDIAVLLGVSPASVDTYRSRIMLKLGVDDLPGLVRFAIRHGITSI